MPRRKSKLPRRVQLRLIEHFVAGTTARMTAQLVGVNRHTATLYYHKLCEIIAERIAGESPFGGRSSGPASGPWTSRTSEGAGRGNAAVEPQANSSCSASSSAEGASTPLSQPIASAQDALAHRPHVETASTVYTDGFASYDTLDTSGFAHYRIDHGEEYMAYGANGYGAHINGSQNFWSEAKRHLWKYNGVPRAHFELFLKECECRFNYGTPRELLKALPRWTLI